VGQRAVTLQDVGMEAAWEEGRKTAGDTLVWGDRGGEAKGGVSREERRLQRCWWGGEQGGGTRCWDGGVLRCEVHRW